MIERMSRDRRARVRLGPVLALCVLASAAPRSTMAQAVGLPAGKVVRLRTTDGERVEGRVLSSDSAALTVAVPSHGERVIDPLTVQSVWTRESEVEPYSRGAAVVGGVATGLVGGVLSIVLCDEPLCDGSFTEGFVLSFPLGAGAGALVGALVGGLVRRWEPLGPIEEPATPGMTWGFRYGRPWGTSEGPQATSTSSGRLGWHLGPRTFIYGEAMHLGYAEAQRPLYPGSGLSVFAEEDASVYSGLVGLGIRLDRRGRVRVYGGAGLAASRLRGVVVDRTGFGEGGPFRSEGRGLHLGLGVEAGWSVGGTRVGFDLRRDWVSASPMGRFGLTSFSVGIWR